MKWGLKNPSDEVIQGHSHEHPSAAQRRCSVPGLKIKRAGIFVFNGEDPSMEQIDGHQESQSHGVA
jgi:hypothetical protein